LKVEQIIVIITIYVEMSKYPPYPIVSVNVNFTVILDLSPAI